MTACPHGTPWCPRSLAWWCWPRSRRRVRDRATTALPRRSAAKTSRRRLRRRPGRARCRRAPPACGDGAGAAGVDVDARQARPAADGRRDRTPPTPATVVTDHHVGGIFIGSWTDLSMLTDGTLPDIAGAAGPLPLAVSVDEEGGRVPAAVDADRPAAVGRGSGADTRPADQVLPDRAGARPGDAATGHHRRLRARRRRHRPNPTTP